MLSVFANYEAPEILGSFAAEDILGCADGSIGGGSVVDTLSVR
jgi:hypothetical protein